MAIVRVKRLAISLATSLIGFGVMAAEPDAFAKLDSDKDGLLEKAELQVPCGREIFAALDHDRDGVIAREEFKSNGDIALYEDKGGIDKQGVKLRWLEFRVGGFDLKDGTFTVCNSTEGQFPLEIDASSGDIERAKETIRTRLETNVVGSANR